MSAATPPDSALFINIDPGGIAARRSAAKTSGDPSAMPRTPHAACASTAARGFTLIELLVATAVFTLLVILLASVLNQMFDITRRSEAQMNRIEGAGTALELLRRDVSKAMLPLDPFNPAAGLAFVLLPAQELPVGIAGDLRSPSLLTFRAPVGAEPDASDIVQVTYYVEWDESESTPRAVLRRRISPEPVAEAGLDPELQGYLAENVLAMVARAVSGETTHYAYNAFQPPAGGAARLPDAVEIALLVADPGAAAQITAVPEFNLTSSGNMDTDINAFLGNLPPGVRQGVRVFRARIPILNSNREQGGAL